MGVGVIKSNTISVQTYSWWCEPITPISIKIEKEIMLDQAIAKGYAKGEPLTAERVVRIRICSEEHRIDSAINQIRTGCTQSTLPEFYKLLK